HSRGRSKFIQDSLQVSSYTGGVLEGFMRTLRLWIILSWIALPTVMYGGYSLLRLINQDNALTPFQTTWFRAGHAHAGVLLLMSLLYAALLVTAVGMLVYGLFTIR